MEALDSRGLEFGMVQSVVRNSVQALDLTNGGAPRRVDLGGAVREQSQVRQVH